MAKFLLNLKTNIKARIAHNLRTRIGNAIRKGYKGGSAVRDLGCSIEKFQKYIASKFVNGMSWKNYGKWHLDHIKALSNFDLTNPIEFAIAAHYTNYQPLWAIDNLIKNKY